MDKSSAYGKAAVTAYTRWNGLKQEEAEKLVEENPRGAIESGDEERNVPGCWAEGSVKTGFETLLAIFESKGIVISEERKARLWDEILNGSGEALKELSEELKGLGLDPTELALEAGSRIHDKWVEGSAKKFNQYEPKYDKDGVQKYDDDGNPIMIDRTSKTYMHNPTELIGAADFFLDYIFLKPVMEEMGMEVDDLAVTKGYWKRQREFLEKGGIKSLDDLKKMIMSPEVSEYYSAVKGYPAGKVRLFQSKVFVDRMVDQMNADGILQGFLDARGNNISLLEIDKEIDNHRAKDKYDEIQ